MRIPSRRRIKKQLSKRMLYKGGIFDLLRLMLFKPWLRVAVAAFLLILISMALFLPKMWVTTPEEFRPIIKISGLDLVQAWSLRRGAERLAAAGQFSEANHSWSTAAANNLGDPDLLRGCIRNTLHLDASERGVLPQTLWHSQWLLRLTGTNSADLELVGTALHHFDLHRQLFHLLDPLAGRHTPVLASLHLKSIFHLGHLERFDRLWNHLPESEQNRAEMKLYRDAFLSGWGDPSQAIEARRRLAEALSDPALGTLAARLSLAESAHRLDLERYASALDQLENRGFARLADHLLYWRMLIDSGRGERARQQITLSNRAPERSEEVLQLTRLYLDLDLKEKALDVLRQFAMQFGSSDELWVTYANLLIDEKRWSDLRSLALQMRLKPGIRDRLSNYSFYLEARAEAGIGRHGVIDDIAQRISRNDLENPSVGLHTARELLKLHQAAAASRLLHGLEETLSTFSEYWTVVLETAFQLKDASRMLQAAARLKDFFPSDPGALNNYAAALIVSHQRPEEAVKLTFELVTRFPDSLAARVNHGLALLLNDRIDEAEAVLAQIDESRLAPSERADFYLAWFQIHLHRRQTESARAAGQRVERRFLFPKQAEWFDEKLRLVADAVPAEP